MEIFCGLGMWYFSVSCPALAMTISLGQLLAVEELWSNSGSWCLRAVWCTNAVSRLEFASEAENSAMRVCDGY